jgi:spoIIIJ-associated protein
VSLETELAPSNPETEGQAYYGDDSYSGDPESPEEAEATAYVAAVLSGIGIHGKISSYREENTLFIDVNGSDCGAAIGRHGETLEAIQYLASLVANKASQERVRVILDIGGYRRRREITLISMAEKAAESVVRNGRNFTLEPMNPSERRIVHSALQSFPGVMTYSEGEEPERHVIIAPNTNV